MLEYIEDIDDKLFKEYGNGKNFNSCINGFHDAKTKKDKEKVVKELKDIDNIVYHYIEMDKNSKYTSKLIDVANVIDYFCMSTLKTGRVILNGGKQSKIIKKILFFSCVCIKCI